MAKAVAWKIDVDGVTELRKALRVLAERDAPYLRAALEESGRELEHAAERRTHASIASTIDFAGVKGTGTGLRAVVRIRHPGGRSREFGRSFYYRDYTGRQQRATGRRFRSSPGQRAEPYLGIVRGDAAIAEVAGSIERRLGAAINAEWERIGAGGGD